MRDFKSLDNFVEELSKESAQRHQNQLSEYIGWVLNDSGLESPIEKILYAAMLATDWELWEFNPKGGGSVVPSSSGLAEQFKRNHHHFRSRFADSKQDFLFIFPQFQIGKYRADFAIVLMMDGMLDKFVVECDGHEFHEKTKEQAARDKSRDRAMSGEGWRVVRFTGSEIYRDPAKCAKEISFIANQMGGQLMNIANR